MMYIKNNKLNVSLAANKHKQRLGGLFSTKGGGEGVTHVY
jgi:hypothetical protein